MNVDKQQIHNQLQKSKIRGIILFPPILFMIMIMLIGFTSRIFNYSVNPFFVYSYLFFFGYMLLVLAIIFWSDLKTMKKLK